MTQPEDFLQKTAEGCRIFLYIQPRASRNRVVGLHDGRLKIQIAAPPVDGAANAEVISFLAGQLGIRKSDIEITSGESGRRKTVLAYGLEEAEARAQLNF